MEELVKKVYSGVLEGQHKQVVVDVQAALDSGVNPVTLLNEGMIAAMAEVGRLFEIGEYYVPEMLISARAMQSGLAVLKPLLKEADVKPAGKVIIGTVKGDLHDIGKNLVAMMLEGAGFEIKDMGTDVSPEKFVEEVKGGGVDVVALSALLPVMPMKTTIALSRRRVCGKGQGRRRRAGDDSYAQQIADGYSPDASRAVNLAKSLVKA
jgi:5-methyltetrahydrofolate--homocysteine methyltransferase